MSHEPETPRKAEPQKTEPPKNGPPQTAGSVADRRQHPRRRVVANATATVGAGPAGACQTHAIITRNMSLGGICFWASQQFTVGQSLQINIPANQKDHGTYLCEVIRSRPLSSGKYEMAAKIREQHKKIA